MRRSLLIGLTGAGALLLGVLWWTSRSPTVPYLDRQPVPGLPDTVTIRWGPEDVAELESGRPLPTVSALGYVHGRERAWTAILWRQTALGQLSRWFGPGLVPLDRHVRRLGLARQARAAYQRLPARSKAYLQAYARGLNAALRTDAVRRNDSFVLLDVTPAPWAPWHALLVGRLMAWLATPAMHAPADAPPGVRAFARTDRRLHRWLHLHGWARSVAWAAASPSRSDSTAPALFQRHVLGASAAPVLQEVRWERPTASTTTWATLPGTLLFPTGTSGRRAWSSLLRSPARLTRTPVDSAALRHRYERIDPSGGDERLVRIERMGSRLLLPRSASDPRRRDTTARSAAPETAWVVEWPGFTTRTDLPAWLRRGGIDSTGVSSSSFELWEADGLEVRRNGRRTVLGNPAVVERGPSRVLVGQSRWARSQARVLAAQLRKADGVDPAALSETDSSAWAAGLFPHLRPTLQQAVAPLRAVRSAIPYLRNWDFRYSPPSIGALVFEQWMAQYRAALGHVPTVADTTSYFARYRQRRALRRALDTLTARLGPDVRRWRWAQWASNRRYFPVWSADSLVSASLQDLATTRYAPLVRRARGHPSALSGGPSLVDPPAVAPAPDGWTGWMRPGSAMRVRRHRYAPTAPRARSRLQTDRPPVRTLSGARAADSTTLVPSPPR
ncbi:MAG: penicillin acylase family protein [Salinibacter sp.]